MPVFGGSSHERSGDGENDDGRADNGGAGQYVGHDAIDDEEAGEDVGESRAGENLVLDAQAGIVPVTLPTRIFAPGSQDYKIHNLMSVDTVRVMKTGQLILNFTLLWTQLN